MLDQVRINKTKSRLLVTGFALAIAVVLMAVTAAVGVLNPVGLLVVAIIVGGAASAAYWASDAVVLRLSRATRVTVEDQPRYHNLVEGLCTAAGLPKPQLCVVDDQAANAFVTGRNPRNAAVVVTTGLLERLNRVELEGVLAHELSHIKSYDIRPSTLAVTMVGGFVLLTPAPVSSWLLGKVINPDRETIADLAAVKLTRYPPGLTSALEKLGEDDTVVTSSGRAMAHLWLCEPSAHSQAVPAPAAPGGKITARRSLDHRLSLLREL